MTISNTYGQLIKKQVLEKGSHLLSLNVQSYPEGVYILSIPSNNNYIIKKIIIKH